MTRFKQISLFIIKLFHILVIKIWNFQFFFKCKRLCKITKKLIAEVHECSRQSDKNSFKQIERARTYVLVYWWSNSHYNDRVKAIYITGFKLAIYKSWIEIVSSQITLSNFLWNWWTKTFILLEFLPSGKPQNFCLHF